jgi:alkanesulfonate monooxygenase SsuD/methylene tetrahydromethanopterin reductase-like flavin-dependent oxidoreductase (luciferase family)
MIELTGSIADGFVAGNTAGPKFVEHAKGLMRSSAHKNGRDLDHGITCYVVFSVDDDSAVARQAVRPLVGFYLGICGKAAHVDVYDYTDHLLQLLDAGGVEYVQANFPDSWLDELAVAGTPAECAAQINRFEAAGVDTLVLLPQPHASATQVLEKAALEVLPLIA